MADQFAPQPTRTRLRTVLAVVASVATAGLGLTVSPPAAAATTSACGSVPSGYNLIESDKQILRGTEGNDFICGNAKNNLILGYGGDDILVGLDGNDRLDGGDGNDVLSGGPGKDSLRGGEGDDVLNGDGGNDKLKGQPGDDVLDGGDDDDKIFAGKGNDVARGGTGDDLVSGNAGNDVVRGGDGNDTVRGKGGKDDIDGEAGNDLANGGAGTDECIGEELLLCEDETTTPTEPDPEPATPVEELTDRIEKSIIPDNASSPWVAVAWEYINENGTVQVSDLANNTAGTVSSSCQFSYQTLPSCAADVFTMDPDFLDADSVIIHELAHVYEGTDGLPIDAAAFGKAQLYFDATYGAVCDYAELIADAMLFSVNPNAYLYYWETACAGSVPHEPTAADMAILNAALDGDDTGWFAANHANGTQGWAAISDADPNGLLSYRLITSQQNEFGGYCSVSHTMSVVFQATSDNNPFADGGC